jgi:signal peptidase
MSEKYKHEAGRTIVNIVLVLAVLLVVFSAASAILMEREDFFLFGYKPFVVGSESMEPEVRKYGIVVIKKTDFNEVKAGDKIAFKSHSMSGEFVFHRVLEVKPEGLVTKGDANKIADMELVESEAFIGEEAWHTNVTARFFPLLRTPKGILKVVVLPLVLIILFVFLVKLQKRYLGGDEDD